MQRLEIHRKRAEELIGVLAKRVREGGGGGGFVLGGVAYVELRTLVQILLISGDGREKLLAEYCAGVRGSMIGKRR